MLLADLQFGWEIEIRPYNGEILNQIGPKKVFIENTVNSKTSIGI